MKSVLTALGAAALALTAGISAHAQNQMGSSSAGLSNPTNVVKNFSVQTVGPVLNELGVPWQVQQLDNGAQVLIAASGSTQFILFFTACQGDNGCVGMQTVTFFRGADPNPQTVQAFNSSIPFVTAGVDQDGEAYISRYDIADYGIPRGNIASSLANFLATAQMFANELANAHQTVSLDGYPSDRSAKHLNRQATEKLTGQPVAAPEAEGFARHQAGMDEGAEILRVLLQEDTVGRNTIEKKVKNELE